MNIKNMKKLIAHLSDAKNPVAFGMGNWFMHGEDSIDDVVELQETVRDHSCNTVACIAGHTVVVAGLDGNTIEPLYSIRWNAAAWLDLENEEAYDLFFGHWADTAQSDITLEETIDHLEHLVEEA